MEHMPQGRPLIAIIDSNTLATLGLKQILQHVITAIFELQSFLIQRNAGTHYLIQPLILFSE